MPSREFYSKRKCEWTAVACAVLCIPNRGHTQNTTTPESALEAHAAWQFNPGKRCPDLQVTDDGTGAVVIFRVGRTGVPSQISIKSSSHSDTLDAAAMSCVLKLRFQPATRLGDGEPLDSWQQMSWDWRQQKHGADSQQAAAQIDSAAMHQNRHPMGSKVAVRVCAGATGKLVAPATVTSSSGNPALDNSAIEIAESGAPYYRANTTIDGKAVSGCAQLTIEFETK